MYTPTQFKIEEVVQDKDWLHAHVAELTDQQEASCPEPWAKADAPASYNEMLVRGIVGMKFQITRLEGKAKMSQNREMRDRVGVVEGLRARGEGRDAETAALVDKLMR